MEKMKLQRQWIKSNFNQWNRIESHEDKKLDNPSLEKEYKGKETLIDLPDPRKVCTVKTNILDIISERRSHRKYSEKAMTIEELSFLLWATQGVKKVTSNRKASFRTVPSAGARHPFETYLAINRVEGFKKGIYRYLALTHQLVLIFEEENLEEILSHLTIRQPFVGKAAVVFIWSCIPYRGEWRYDIMSHKHMILDAGHICQNLYLSCEAIGCGTCAVGAYDQQKIDEFLGLDGEDEFVAYIAPVGKV